MRPALTQQQQSILGYVRRQIAEEGLPPTGHELAAAFGFASINAARSHLQALARKGYLELRSGSARGIRLIDSDPDANAQPDRTLASGSAAPAVLTAPAGLPVLGRIAAGQPLMAEQHIDEWLPYAPEMFRPHADFLHRVEGHSMHDAGIHDGDLVAIHAQPDADNGQIVAAVIPDRHGEDRVTLKRYRRHGSRITLLSENADPRYRPIELELAGIDADSQDAPAFWIAGIYVGLMRLSLR
jgi:repressor LexA